jgi:deoxyribose-phosphate aldolase
VDENVTRREIAALIDHTLLRPEAAAADVRKLCLEARQYGFASVCVNSYWVPLAAGELKDSAVKVCTVVGFPLGACATTVKQAETEWAIRAGAREIDMVINIGELRGGNCEAVRHDIAAVVGAAHSQSAIVKVILETALLDAQQKTEACGLAKQASADFVKTSTGFGCGGATAADVALMRQTIGPEMGVKASGGIRTLEDLERMVAAGATRIGTSSGVKIIESA